MSKVKTVFWILAGIALLALLFPLLSAQPKVSKADAAQAILTTFQSNMAQLKPEKQGHFFLRLYRLSGDPQHLPAIRAYGEILSGYFKNHTQNLDSETYLKEKTEELLKLKEDSPGKNIIRSRLLKRWDTMVTANRVLYLAFQIKSLGLDQGALQDDFQKALTFLSAQPYREFLLDPAMIRYYASRTANIVHYLKYLGLEDHEKTYSEKFREIFFQTADSNLDSIVFTNKIYGMTHFIIAASNFYQNPVPAEKYQWILDYFSKNFGEIQDRTNPDILAEVAVCFKLAGQTQHPVIPSVERYLLSRFDAAKGLIPSSKEDKTLDDLEHRNIMGYLALTDFEKLYPGPDLSSPA